MTTATFEPDLVPLLPDELHPALALLAESRRRLLDQCGVLRSAPKAAALLAFRSELHRQTIEEQLRHIASAERWYLSKIIPELPHLPVSRDVWQRLAVIRQLVVESLAGLSGAALGCRARINGELWTTRKVIRRLMYHEQFHRDCVRRDLKLAGGTGACPESAYPS